MSRRGDLALIHQAKRDLGMDDAAYRAMLRRLTGLDSAGAMDAGDRAKVIARFESLGWRPPHPRRRHHGTDAQRRKIAALLTAAGRDTAYGDGIAEQMFRRPVALLAAAELRAVIAALERDRQRREARGG